jgi:glycosyltransferase involved in cell wall biosynthesis
MKRPAILVIDNSIDVTGALKSVVRTAFDLQQDFNFHFIIPKNARGRFWIEGKGFTNIKEISMFEISKRIIDVTLYIPFLLFNVVRLRKYVKAHEITLIHVNDLYNLLPVLHYLLWRDTPYVCHIRFMPDRFPKWLLHFWLSLHFRCASKIIVVSKSVLNQLPIHPKLVLIHNELPGEERYPNWQELDSKETHVFLYLSNTIRGKGQDYALKAFSVIHKLIPTWKLRFVGGDMGLAKNKAFLSELKNLALNLGIANKIEWFGFTEEVELEYKSADIVLNFSESESFSITCLEALFFGRPVIASDCGGPAEIIDHGETGLLVPNKHVEAMSTAMLHLASDKQRIMKMGKKASEIVRIKFSLAQTSMKLKTVYQSIIKIHQNE